MDLPFRKRMENVVFSYAGAHKFRPVHGDGTHKRAYLYVKDVVEAYDTILHKGAIGNERCKGLLN